MPTPTPTSPTPPTTSHVGRYARSIETGWLGKVIAVEDHGEPMLKMIGVNQLYRTMKGGHIDDALDHDDTQWFAPADVRFCTLV